MLKSPTKILYQSGTLYPDDIHTSDLKIFRFLFCEKSKSIEYLKTLEGI
jgi:hypothetical protein